MSFADVKKSNAVVQRASEGVNKAVKDENYRLVDKNNKQLLQGLTELQSIIEDFFVTEAPDENSTEYKYCINALNVAKDCLNNAETFMSVYEEKQARQAESRVVKAQIDELKDKVTHLSSLIKTSPKDLDLEEAEVCVFLEQAVKERERVLNEIKVEKSKLRVACMDEAVLLDLFTQALAGFDKVMLDLDSWIGKAKVLIKQHAPKAPACPNPDPRRLELKLDRVSLPTFDGSLRSYARFKREFEATVGSVYEDPSIKLLYLQNQCLTGVAKEAVKNLTRLEDVFARLDERFGNTGAIVGEVVRELDQLRLGTDVERGIIKIHSILEGCWDDVEAVGALSDFCNIITLRTIEGKLPERVKIKWFELKIGIMNSSVMVQMQTLKTFLEKERKVAEAVSTLKVKSGGDKSDSHSKWDSNKGGKKFNGHLGDGQGAGTEKKGCYRCGFTGHLKMNCKVPRSIKCRRCNKIGHMERACDNATSSSTEEKTNGKDSTPTDDKRVTFRDTSNKSSPAEVKSCVSNKGVRLPVEEIVTDVGNCNVLYDSGSMINIVEETWAVTNGLKGRKYDLEYRVVDGETKRLRTKLYTIGFKDCEGRSVKVRAYGMDSVLKNLQRPDLRKIQNVFFDKSCGISMSEVSLPTGDVHLLLGTEYLSMFPVVVQTKDDACILQSKVGKGAYVLAGSHPLFAMSNDSDSIMHASFVSVSPVEDLCENYVHQIQERRKKALGADFWSLEALGTHAPKLCKMCKNCASCKFQSQVTNFKEANELQVIKSNLTYNEDEKCWHAKYPFVENPSVLRDNYKSALAALERRELRLLKNAEMSCQYNEQVEDFVTRGVLRKLTGQEVEEWMGPVRYVDHHEVFKAGSTTPVRLVVNSSFKRGDEKSLNDILLKGPSLLKDIFEILVRWRMHSVAFIGDIQKMYHSVKTGSLEGHVRRFLWRSFERDRDPDVFVFDRVTFGDRPAGCIVVTALQETALMFKDSKPKASEVILNDSYVDDVVSGAGSLHEARALVEEVQDVAASGGFKFKQFTFSGQRKEVVDIMGSSSLNSVLGTTWNAEADMIVFLIDINPAKRVKGRKVSLEDIGSVRLTKRVCLRIVNSIFDPLGMLTPVTALLKIMMKDTFVINNANLGWDQPLSELESAKWREMLLSLRSLTGFAVPRCVVKNYSGTGSEQRLVCFVDASLKAMCAVVYICSSDGGNIEVHLLAAKARVSPTTYTTIPRLELSAALIGARLVDKIKRGCQRSFDEVLYFSDSKVVLGMLNNSKSLLKEFVGIRVNEIRSLSEVSDWKWIPTELNVADLGSRGVHPEKFIRSKDWLEGPDWLRLPKPEWPVSLNDSSSECSELDLKVGHVLATVVTPCRLNAANYRSLAFLLKVTAYIVKFIYSLKKSKPDQIDADWRHVVLSAEDFEAAESYWMREMSESVLDMYESGKLSSLKPSVEWDNVAKYQKVVISGRPGKLLKIGYDNTQLIVLDPNHPYTRLVLKQIHYEDHAGDSRVVWKSRVKYWIPHARKIVRSIRKSCYICRILKKQYARQIMAPLPAERLLPAPVWSNVALDLFGPLEHVDLVRKRLKSKAWGIVITCLVSRAVHLDLTQSYDTDSVLQALHRFVFIRGTPSTILSDQGSQLKAASREVANMLEVVEWNTLKGWCAKERIRWRFAPVQGQHVNGCCEALIKSTKRILEEKVRGKRLNYAELQTVLFQIAQILNSRPLGIYSQPGDDPLDGGPVTPNHLLLGRASSAVPNQEYDTNASLTKRIRFIRETVEEFWNKWKVVAFDSLVPQYRWHRKFRCPQIGDVVLIQDETSKVAEFRLGIVIGLKLGLDGLARTLTIRYKKPGVNTQAQGITTRPIQRVVTIVPIEEQ